MKRIFIIIVIFSSVLYAHQTCAQIAKGTRFIKAGELTMASNRQVYKNDYNEYYIKSSSLSISSGIGYFILNNLTVGVDLKYSGNKSILKGDFLDQEFNSSDFSFGPFVRYYVLGKVFVGTGYQHSLTATDDFPIEIGGAILLNSKLSIEPSLKVYQALNGGDGYLSLGVSLSVYLDKRN